MTNETATTTIPYDMFNRFMDGITDAIPNISRENAEKLAISISNIAISSDDRKIEDRVEREANKRKFATSEDILTVKYDIDALAVATKQDISVLKQDISNLDHKIENVEQRLDIKIDKLDTKIDSVKTDVKFVKTDVKLNISKIFNRVLWCFATGVASILITIIFKK